jgi:hypothetical protein
MFKFLHGPPQFSRGPSVGDSCCRLSNSVETHCLLKEMQMKLGRKLCRRNSKVERVFSNVDVIHTY